jgi:hypothetical protein
LTAEVISPLSLRPPVKPDSGVGLGSQSAFIRACQPEPWRRLVIRGEVIPSVSSVASCKIRCRFGCGTAAQSTVFKR